MEYCSKCHEPLKKHNCNKSYFESPLFGLLGPLALIIEIGQKYLVLKSSRYVYTCTNADCINFLKECDEN
jgi:hypothetical protein